MQAVILAGGKATRMRPLTLHTPKPIVPIVGRPFLAYTLDMLRRAHVREVTLALSYQPQKIEDMFGDGSHSGVRLRYIVESLPLGTAGAVRNAREHIDTRAIVLNGDILTDVNLTAVLTAHRESGAAATIVLAPVDNPRAYGVVETDETGRVTHFLEKPAADQELPTNNVNAGIYVIEPEVLTYMPAGETVTFEYDLFPALLEQGVHVQSFTAGGYWTDIGTPRRFLRANLDVLAGRLGPTNVPVRETVERADPKAEIDALSWLDPSVTVKAGAQIVNSVIEDNCVIEERALIENAVIRRASRVGQSATVRDSVIGQSTHVGRFSVVSGAAIGDKSTVTDYSQLGEMR
ncbi:MAG: NDP-sugar synthase [Blastocatellia bacterium]|jgi:NDP-sugar pyrophosphorylase family protein|nr:NDP-sugar synthase [Blastocatellia bacterium]MBK6428930.1 NDP-sugar synthase [Blastocatellia bacterium]